MHLIFGTILEAIREAGLETLMKIIRAHFQENSSKFSLVASRRSQKFLLYTIETGLLSNTVRFRMCSFLLKPGVTDAELISQLNTAVAEEAERNSKLGIGQKGKAKVTISPY